MGEGEGDRKSGQRREGRGKRGTVGKGGGGPECDSFASNSGFTN